MDEKTFIARLAKATGRDTKEIKTLTEALGKVITGCLCENDSVALPGFGEFSPVKDDEKIVTDPISGKSVMMPPHIGVTFTPSSLLKRKIAERP